MERVSNGGSASEVRDLSNVQRDEKGRIKKKEEATEEKKQRKSLINAILGLSDGVNALKKVSFNDNAKKVGKGLGAVLGGLLR